MGSRIQKEEDWNQEFCSPFTPLVNKRLPALAGGWDLAIWPGSVTNNYDTFVLISHMPSRDSPWSKWALANHLADVSRPPFKPVQCLMRTACCIILNFSLSLFVEVPRNDTCPELPEITNGWKTTSHPELVHGTVVTYQCYPGFEVVGTEMLMCQWDLTWSGDLPTCERGESSTQIFTTFIHSSLVAAWSVLLCYKCGGGLLLLICLYGTKLNQLHY